MKRQSYLSPSAISQWLKSVDEYYLKYLSDNRPDKIPQTAAMAVGSSFDAYVKSYLHEALFGAGSDAAFAFDALFATQVEPANRDVALTDGKTVFDAYLGSGALADIMLLCRNSSVDPRFEFTAMNGNIEQVVLLGKPDCVIRIDTTSVVLDWKVNGFYSSYSTSPMKGYVNLRGNHKRSGLSHKDAILKEIQPGLSVNIDCLLENVNVEWARQLAIYSWLTGEPVGSDFVVAIDQLCCNDAGSRIAVAQHRSHITPTFQTGLLELAQRIWMIVNSDWIFRDLSFEESAAKCLVLDNTRDSLAIDDFVKSLR